VKLTIFVLVKYIYGYGEHSPATPSTHGYEPVYYLSFRSAVVVLVLVVEYY